MQVTKDVIPAAGFGTRFLPVTKAQPEEMITFLDNPTTQYVVEEALEAGITDILFITGKGKQAIDRHFDKSYELEEELERNGKTDRLERVREISDLADIHYIRQQERNGPGDAVLYVCHHIGDEPFALLLGDTIIHDDDEPYTRTLVRYAEEYGCSVLSLERVSWGDVSAYGVGDLGDIESTEACFQVEEFVEKPPQDDAPSNLDITGRYVLTPEFFELLDATPLDVGGELQLRDAIRELGEVRGVELGREAVRHREHPGLVAGERSHGALAQGWCDERRRRGTVEGGES